MVRLVIHIIVFIVLADTVIADAEDKGTSESDSLFVLKNFRKKKKNKDRSTSSDSGRKSDESDADDTLDLSISTVESSKNSQKSYMPKSTFERHGWRKWHRKCARCFEDEKLKWRDQRIKWICGEYQRARRSFKSLCTMHYRNCQDGTMFIKIKDHRCLNDTLTEEFPHGDHFFYEYKALLEGESTDSKESDSTTSDSEDDSYQSSTYS